MSSQVPEGRYGSRARRSVPPVARWALAGLAIAVLVAVALVGYQNLGSPPIEGKQTAFAVLDDGSMKVTAEVQRDDPAKAAACVIRGRAESGEEVGRKEILVPPADGTIQLSTVLRTSHRATIGEVYGCTYRVPEYLSTHQRPTG
ncbi:DUF4307 domain-containing protein [Saccharopolyspora gloriosae]|uniref:DUF4307 domain-containing protein n=1 Tax=Saccharopolyspora gloriosae TaxID=455344 RepID=UPI001FB65AEC|nr:DUF4307 domain-containing protein [Saccharopolyspora gloriosae]